MGTVALRPIDQLERDWEVVRRSPASRVAAERLAGAEPVVAHVAPRDLGDLVAALRRDRLRSGGRADAAALLSAMLRSQGVHPLVGRAILQAVLPGLVSVARRLSWGSGGEWEDGGAFFVDTITTAWEVISEWSGEDRAYAVLDLLSAVRCRLRRQLLRHRSLAERFVPAPDGALEGSTWHAGQTDLDELARAIEVESQRVVYGHKVI